MAVMTKGKTFGATEEVTNTKLHNLVDNGTVTGILNADCSAAMNLDESKVDFDGSSVVLVTGNQTIAGVKTFSSFPVTPSSAPTTNYQSANKKYVDDNDKDRVPTGTLMMWSSTVAPTNYLLCDGTAYSRASYSGLYTVVGNSFCRIGTLSTRTDADTGVITLNGGAQGITDSDTFNVYWAGDDSRTGMTITDVTLGAITVDGGSGDDLPTEDDIVWCSFNSNKFMVPDFRGRMGIGIDSSGGTSADVVVNANADTIGLGDGYETHTLTEAELASHTHTIEKRQWDASSGGIGLTASGVTPLAWVSFSNELRNTETGGDTAHNNMPPWLAINYIIRT